MTAPAENLPANLPRERSLFSETRRTVRKIQAGNNGSDFIRMRSARQQHPP
jgi:hypothetical protein